MTKAFPSGDTGMAAALLLTAGWYSGQWWVILLAPIVGIGRVYFGCHWIGDVIVGAGMGFAVAGVVGAILTSRMLCPAWGRAGSGFETMCDGSSE